jgi:hypothetical protein
MWTSLRARAVDREQLLVVFTNVNKAAPEALNLDELVNMKIPDRGAIIGYWGENHADPLPDFLVVRDEDVKDTFAWLSSYFSGVAPITQWCRICTASEMKELIRVASKPTVVGSRLGVWVGTILAECSVQANYNINLKELPGTAALTSATFAAARAIAVWGRGVDLSDLARRHEEMYTRLRESGRPVPAAALLPIWHTIQCEFPLKLDLERRALEPLGGIVETITSKREVDAEFIQEVAASASKGFSLPELSDCAHGPQSDRVKALDQLARQLGSGAKSPALQALLGFGASLIDPGAAVLPELLRKYLGTFPLAPIWLGAFAGAWSPIRVLTDHQGLGRIIAKSILADSDLQSKPSCDIAFEEISRWLGSDTNTAKISLRGMAARSINIELLHGVTCPFAVGRLESYRSESSSIPAPNRSEAQDATRPKATTVGTSPQVLNTLELLTKRIEVVEKAITRIREDMNAPEAPQTDLLGDSVNKGPDDKPAKRSRWRRS